MVHRQPDPQPVAPHRADDPGRVNGSKADASAHGGATKLDIAIWPTDGKAERRGVDRSKADAIANAHVGATKLDIAILRTQAKAALVGLGWKSAIAHAAIAAAVGEHGDDVTLERLIFEALRRCPVPRG